MIGLELQPNIATFTQDDKPAAVQFINRLHEKGVLTIPSGTHIVRLLPALNLQKSEAEEGLEKIEALVATLV